MAYNPFAVFRRNQKTLFAILTVFIMVMFTLSFGAGDFFQWLPQLIGSVKARGTEMAKIAGRTVTDLELEAVARNRLLANEFMLSSASIAADKLDRYFKGKMEDSSPGNRPAFLEFYAARNSEFPYVSPQFTQSLRNNSQLMSMLNQFVVFGLEEQRRRMSAIASTAASSKDDVDLARTALSLTELDSLRLFNSQVGYFGHKADGDDTLRAAFDFELWKRKAHQLGIRYSIEDAKQIYLNEFYDQVDAESLAAMERQVFGNRAGYNRDQIFQALADEFSVRFAKQIVLGSGNAPQAFPSPWDAYEFFRQQCNGGSYDMILIPSENYLAKVTGTPTESEYRKLFDQYRNREPDPAKDNLGLREPRKIKVGWLEVKGDEPFFEQLGAVSLAQCEAAARAFGVLLAPLPGSEWMAATAAVPCGLIDPALAGAYAAYRDKFSNDLYLSWFPSFFADSLSRVQPTDVSLFKPTNFVSALAEIGGSLASFGGALAGPLLFIEQARFEDRAARAAPLVALLAPPTPAGGLGLGSALAAGAHFPPPLPLAMVREQLLEKVKAETTRRAIELDLAHFAAELEKLGAKPDKQEARDYLARYVQERGLSVHETAEFHTQYTLGLDPAMKPLLEKFAREPGVFDPQRQLGFVFFFERDFQGQIVPATSLYSPQQFLPRFGINVIPGEPTWLTWRADERAPESPKDLDRTKPRILELYRTIEARKLAEAAAARFADDVRKLAAAQGLDTKEENLGTTPAVEAIVREVFEKIVESFESLSERARVERFAITDVAPISMPEAAALFQPQAQPRPFRLEPRREMPYPTEQMRTLLLSNKDGKPATTLVLHDQAKDRFYIAVLKHRQDRRTNEFFESVFRGGGQLATEINGSLQREAMQKSRREAIELLKAEFQVEVLNDKLKS